MQQYMAHEIDIIDFIAHHNKPIIETMKRRKEDPLQTEATVGHQSSIPSISSISNIKKKKKNTRPLVFVSHLIVGPRWCIDQSATQTYSLNAKQWHLDSAVFLVMSTLSMESTKLARAFNSNKHTLWPTEKLRIKCPKEDTSIPSVHSNTRRTCTHPFYLKMCVHLFDHIHVQQQQHSRVCICVLRVWDMAWINITACSIKLSIVLLGGEDVHGNRGCVVRAITMKVHIPGRDTDICKHAWGPHRYP